MQLQRQTTYHSLPLLDSWAFPCVSACSFVKQAFFLMLKIFVKPGGVHGMHCIPWLHWRGWSAATQTQGHADLDCCTWLSHPFFFLLAAKINSLRTVHSLLPFLQIPFYCEHFLQVKWSNCKRFLCLQWKPQSERKPAEVSPQQTEAAPTQLLQKTFPHHLIWAPNSWEVIMPNVPWSLPSLHMAGYSVSETLASCPWHLACSREVESSPRMSKTFSSNRCLTISWKCVTHQPVISTS